MNVKSKLLSKNYFRKIGLILILGLLSAVGLTAQSVHEISGTISDVTGEPLIGASVTEKGTSNGTVTDANGQFTLNVKENATVEIFYIGYKTQALNVGQTREFKITLEEELNVLNEVVAIGYAVQKKKLNTGATVQVKGDDLVKLNTLNPLQAMQGQTPGVSIISTSGQPGSNMKVTIRGLGTVGNSQPLYLIDGVGGDISTLNPADIESIDILKDAASAAIYGASAANGVVLVTTKRGKEGKANVTFDAYYGVQNVVRKAHMLNAEEYKTLMDEQSLNSGGAAFNWDSYSSIYDASGKLIDTDWIDAMFKDNAQTENYTLGVTGGSAFSVYAVSLSYMNQEGIVGGKNISNYERYNFRTNAEQNVFKNVLKVGEQITFIYAKNTGIGVGNQYDNTLHDAFNTSPLSPIYSDNNIYDSPFNDTSHSDWYNNDGNPYGYMMTNTNNKNNNATFAGNVYAELQPIANLKFKTVFGAVYGSSKYRSFTPLYQFSNYIYNTTRTIVLQNMNTSLGMTWTNTASYDLKLGEQTFNALLGMESYRYSGDYLGGGTGSLKEGFDDWEHAYIDNGTATGIDNGLSASGHPYDEVRSVSYFGRIGWNWKETYLANATLRSDGSSKFARGHRFGYFPSVSVGWVLTNEKFAENWKDYMDFLKIRASWGQVGNANIDNYQFTAPIKSDHTHYIFGTTYGAEAQAGYWGAYPSRWANENIKWETSEQTNLGLDARFLKGRLNMNFDFYIKTTKDWLVQAPILATAGTDGPYINGGNVKNTGVELALNWNDNIGDFRYNLGINGAYNRNRVGNIPNEDGIIHGLTNQLYDNTPEFYRAQNGFPIGYFWGYQTAGVFQNKEQIASWNSDGKHGILQASPQPGDVIYVDQNGDGLINDLDKTNLGNGMPDFTCGFNLGFDYKGIDFSLNAYGMVGNKIVQSYRNHSNKYANYSESFLARWTGEGTSNRIPRVTETNINWQFSDLYIHDGDLLRISNITLGYDFAKLLRCKAIGKARLYAQVQNAFTFTKYDGMDPEIGYGTETDSWVSGLDVGYYPRPRTVLFGINLSF
ncbi:MAG: TonB-dependent receptor [Candidatus Azobacteroides sp.]|nr:TonB-dependent receptor [Candidatus Azobacteroides sp.]